MELDIAKLLANRTGLHIDHLANVIVSSVLVAASFLLGR